MAKRNKPDKKKSRRNFINSGLKCGAGALLFSAAASSCSKPKEKVKALTQDGRLIEVDASEADCCAPATPEEARNGIPNRKFVMVIDLSRCRNARKCVEKCQEAHHLLPGQEYMRIYLMQRSEKSAP